MSQLRKSASFRSRIPVRRRLAQRRCSSPQPNLSNLKGLKSNRSYPYQGGHRHYSSSSYSSNDESSESEVCIQKFQQKQPQHNNSRAPVYRSNDTISLDDVLDSVSCGSFSSPPSPVQYQNTKMPSSRSSSYESLDKYNTALETFKLNETTQNIPYQLIQPSAVYKNIDNINKKMDSKMSYGNKMSKIDISRDDAKKSHYVEKQRNLSDWYYIKNSPKSNEISKPINNHQYPVESNQMSSHRKASSISSLSSPLPISTSTPPPLPPPSPSSVRIITTPTSTTTNNFDYRNGLIATQLSPGQNGQCTNKSHNDIKNKFENLNIVPDGDGNGGTQINVVMSVPGNGDCQPLYQHYNNRQNNYLHNHHHQYRHSPHHHHHHDHQQNHSNHQESEDNSNETELDFSAMPDNIGVNNVNSFKQQMQMQYKQQKSNNNSCNNNDTNSLSYQYNVQSNANSSTTTVMGGTDTDHFENGDIQQEEHWQNITNINSKTLDGQHEIGIYDDRDLPTTSNHYNNGPNALYQRQNHQQLTQKQLQHHKQQDHLHLHNQHQQQQQQQLLQSDQFKQQHQQQQPQQQQKQHQPLIRSQKQGQNQTSPSSVITNYKGSQNRLDNIRALGISTSVSSPPIRAKFIQKRSDETSCSSFEQLNILGIPTTTSTTTTTATAIQFDQPIEHTDCSNLNEIIGGYEGQVSQMTRALYENIDVEHKLMEAKRRPLPQLPIENEIFPPKTTSCRSECELSGSYASLECPSPPGPPICLPESRRDPQARLSTYLRTFYTDLALKEPIIPPWAIPVAPGALSPSRLEPELRLHSQSHGFNDCITVDQILISLQTKEGTFLEAPRRVLIECPSWTSRSNLCLRILHAWAKEPPWPSKGTPVALALFIPLNELKRGFASYVEKELLPKGPLNPFASGFGGFTAAWNSLESLGPKLLIVLDGYDIQRGSPKRKGKHYPPDVHDLLDGKLFSEARVIITTSTTHNTELMPLIQRHITYEGLTWGRSASLLGGGQWGGPSRLLDTVQESVHLRKVVRTPWGCLAVAAIYDATAGDLPTDELDVVESVLNCVAPETSPNNVAELGRLALFCLKMKRPCITIAEIRMYCSSPESNILGCLDKSLLLGKSAKKKAEYVYNPMCAGMAEFLAANYISSLANRPGLLAAEITGLSIGDELDPDLLKVIKFSMGLLGTRAHVLLSKLTPLWLTPQIVFSLALAGGCSEDNLAALCDILGISKHPPISPLEAKPLWVQVRSVPTDLLGWGMALKSPTCTLKNLEVIYQLEKHSIMESRNAIEVFLDSLALNESVSTLRLCSLIETEVKDSEIAYLASCVSKVLIKPRLENFELVLTLLEEDPPILKLQSVVTALCRSIPHQTKLSFLLLDLGLSTSQLVQLCATLEKCPNVTRLSLPHLRCEKGAIAALASLLNSRPMSFLSLPSCWGARDDPPSSSGVSMGSGSGSSTGTSGLIKQGSLPGVPSPRSYPPGLFSSLPRGIFVPTTTLGRSATLPRQPMEQTIDKRSCDSVVSKTWYPTPACDGGPHNSGTLHDLLLAAREPYSKLHGLDLSKAQLSLEDSMCLGETVRLSNTLHTLKLEGSSRLSEILPSVLGASESPCLQMLSIGSPRLSLEDSAIAMCARALTSCSTLRLLSLDGWGFRIENPATLSILRAFLSLTSIRELSLANGRLQISLIRSDTKIIQAFESRSVVVLKLSGAQAILADSTILRGPQLLPYVGGFPCLRELDLSAPARSGLGTTHSSPLILDDKCVISFFQNLHTHFSLLNTLKICNWVIHFDDLNRTLKTISKCIRNSPISHIKLDGISVLDRPKKQRIESQLIHCFISSLPLLRWMGISLSGKKEDQITAIGNAVLDLKGYEIDIKLSESTIEHAKLMAQAISLDGKFDIKVSTFGTSSGILIHAEKSGTKSLTRKTKD